jgi:N-acetylneuraminic acid mutarotase
MSFFAILRRGFDSRPTWATLIAAVVVPAAFAAAPTWNRAAPVAVARTEVAAARHGSEIVVVGGYLASGETTDEADAYAPATDRWRQLPRLPVAVNHAMAATWRGRIVVAGGYPGTRPPSARVFVLERNAWRELARMPAGRGAAGAAVIGDTLYIVGGIGPSGLARNALALNLRAGAWRTIPGPTPREHLAVASSGGRVYALAGRVLGLDTNVNTVESWRPGERRWRRHPPVPRSRGGTGAAAVGRTIVSVGGEEPGGTIRTVYAFDTRTRRWRRLADLPSPRHGLGVVAFNRRVYAIAGGPRPGLTVSGANEYLTLP